MINNFEDYREEIEAIKLALNSVAYMNCSIIGTVNKAVEWQYYYFSLSQDRSYLDSAIIHMQAFLEMGFTYDDASDIFDTILKELGKDKNEVFPKRFYASKKVKLNKNQIRRMIGRWSPSRYHTKPINEVVEDIIFKVKNQEKGVYFYHSNDNPSIPEFDIIYELVINDEESYFHDVSKNKYYTFII